MINKYNYGKVEWVDIEKPTEQEIGEIMEKYSLSAIVGEELYTPSLKPKVEFFNDYMLLVLRFPVRIQQEKKYVIKEKEIDFVVGKNYVITTRYETVEPIHNISKIIDTNTALKKGGEEDAPTLLYLMLRKLYERISIDLEGISDELKYIESRVFEGREREMVERLSGVGREIIDYSQILMTHNDPLLTLRAPFQSMFGNESGYLVGDLISIYKKISEKAENNKRLQVDLRSTNDSLLTSKQNEVMKIFTIMAFITFPLSLFVELVGLDTSRKIILGSRYDLEIVVGVVFLALIFMVLFFKKKRWI